MRTRLIAATTAAATALTLAPFAAADPAPVTGVELNQPADQVIAVVGGADPDEVLALVLALGR